MGLSRGQVSITRGLAPSALTRVSWTLFTIPPRATPRVHMRRPYLDASSHHRGRAARAGYMTGVFVRNRSLRGHTDWLVVSEYRDCRNPRSLARTVLVRELWDRLLRIGPDDLPGRSRRGVNA